MIPMNSDLKETVTPLLMTPRQAAAALSVSERTLFNLEKRGKLIPVRIGTSKRYDPEALRKFIELLRTAPVSKESKRT